MISCYLEDVATQALWNSGSQICLLNERWRAEHIPHIKVQSIEEILGSGTLVGKAVNQTAIPFIGWVEVRFQLGTDTIAPLELKVPMLVTEEGEEAEEPIITYKVIEVLLKMVPEQLPQTTFSTNSKCAEKLTKLIQMSDPQSIDGIVRLGHQKVTIPPILSKIIKCGVRTSALLTEFAKFV